MTEVLGQSSHWQSASLAEIPPLKAHEVHLWWLPLTLNESQTKLALELLSDLQRDKYHRRANQRLKSAYLAGRYYLLHLLGAYSGQKPEDIELSYSRLNKPSLSDPKLNIDFNFTDTDGADHSIGLFAFSKAHSLGVDVENRARDIDVSRVVAKRFSDQEQAFVLKGDKVDRERALSIWTRKEAYGKATGNGINFRMNAENLISPSQELHKAQTTDADFSFAFNDSLNQAWRCEQFQLGTEFIACVVHEGHQKLSFKAFNSLSI